MAVGDTTSAVLAADAVPVYIAKKVLAISEKMVVMDDLCEETPFPEGMGRTVQWTRYNRLRLPRVPLVEGVTPQSTPLTNAIVQAVLAQWGVVCTLTDVAQLTIAHPTLQIALDMLGLNHSELRDREAQKVAMAGTNVDFAGAATSRATLGAGDVVNGDFIAQQVATLRQAGARGIRGKLYCLVVDPFVNQDIQKDSVFVQAHIYQEHTKLLNAESGTWKGMIVKESNTIPILSLLAAADYVVADSAAAGGETGFAAASSVPVVITRLNDETGFEEAISIAETATDAGIFTADLTIAAAAQDGTYRMYVGLENATVATLQTEVEHTSGVATTRSFIKAGTPANSTTMVVQATGPVAPAEPPAAGNVHTSYVVAKQHLGKTNLGKKMEGTLTPKQVSDSDPLGQRRKAGYKTMMAFAILNPDFGIRLESRSAFN